MKSGDTENMERENQIGIFLSRYKDKKKERRQADVGEPEEGISEDNIFFILNIENKEVFHSRFLKYLIENNWDSFAGNVLEKKCGGLKDAGALQYAQCEYPCDAIENCPQAKQGRLDLYFETEKYVIAVEVKWHAGEQPLQLLRYYDSLQRQNGGKVKLFFLTPEGKKPAKTVCRERCETVCRKSLGEGEYFTLSFRDISAWIRLLRAGREKKDTYLLDQYYEILQEEERSMAQIETLGELLKSPEDFETANCIARSFEKICGQIRKEFFEALANEIKRAAENLGKGFVGVRSEKREYKNQAIVFRPGNPPFEGGEEEIACCYGYDTNLYCHDRSGWWYITPEWFVQEKCTEGKNNNEAAENNKNKVDVKNFGIYDRERGNPVINWYYGGKQAKPIENVVRNMFRYFCLL